MSFERIKKPKEEPNIIIDGIIYKKCMGDCGEVKRLNTDNFKWRPDSKKWRNMCRICINLNDTKPRKENYKNIDKTINNITVRCCVVCLKDKELSEANFYFRDKFKNSFFVECCECISIRYSKEYDANKIIKIKIPKIKKHDRNAHRRKKYKEDPSYKLRGIISKVVNFMLKKNKTGKRGASILDYLKYNINDLRSHLESQFESWMNWNNWGKYNPKTWNDNDQSTWVWNIDHIIPQSKLQYDSMDHPNFYKTWDLSNLRPFSAKQNILDGNRH